ncbi:hypothetical protein LTR78_003091 [Recurvomyces mirabilis]|uniref:Peptidase S53 domain-containing protein n=1 Tax=Recurvomyces mirabilis TaxID=574656 RepID=A0AAE0WRV8_9PEZI|nr:hypothetical protein LTR78_003091 [Recurvomyces mirabilis]KAK5157087.1 hypothetical protein LTS14_004605 [Recurvomyces mirabilis]
MPGIANIRTLLRPDVAQLDDVSVWLQSAGLDAKVIRSNTFQVSTTIGEAESLLNATYHIYTNGERSTVWTTSYTLPEPLNKHIEFVTPITAFPFVRNFPFKSPEALKVSNLQQRVNCGSSDYTSPNCIRQVYNITYTAQPNRTTFAIYATEAASYRKADMDKFLRTYNPPAAAANPQIRVVGTGDPKDGSPGITGAFETHLDTQTAFGLAWPAQGVLYNLGGVFGPTPGQVYDPYVSFLQDLLTNETVPSVVSFSETTPNDMVDPAYARSVCNMMRDIGSRGVSLLFSSGDNGPQGDQPTGKHSIVFEPEFPASCPWVTSVDGTTNMAAETAATQQTISDLINKFSSTASGGGFSNLFPRPAYQDEAVSAYAKNSVPSTYSQYSGFKASGRGMPDISAFSTNFPVVYLGLTFGVGGTSASTPLCAAIVTLLNDYEASQGRPPLGFPNPWLYGLNKNGLHDITGGGFNNGSCNWLSECRLPATPGYPVTTGWDAVTGLGSPTFDQLRRALDMQAAASGLSYWIRLWLWLMSSSSSIRAAWIHSGDIERVDVLRTLQIHRHRHCSNDQKDMR